jgi:small-conductance mechanosensitive channel
VTEITTRYTVLKHPGGTEFIVPNETLISTTVQNQTFSNAQLRLTTMVGVAYDADLDKAVRLMVEAAAAHTRVLESPAPKVFSASLPTAASTSNWASGSTIRKKARATSFPISISPSGAASRKTVSAFHSRSAKCAS